jgi:hypothetical protein
MGPSRCPSKTTVPRPTSCPQPQKSGTLNLIILTFKSGNAGGGEGEEGESNDEQSVEIFVFVRQLSQRKRVN